MSVIKKFILALLVAILALLAIIAHGMFRYSDDPMNAPKRVAFHKALVADCLDGSDAEPDVQYCEAMVTSRTNCVDNVGREVLANSILPGIENSYCPHPKPDDEIKHRRSAERSARMHGTDGSTRFTGTCERTFEEQEWKAFCRYLRDVETEHGFDNSDAIEQSGCDKSFEDAQGYNDPNAAFLIEAGSYPPPDVCPNPYQGWFPDKS